MPRYTSGMMICLDEAARDSGTLKKIHEIVRGYPGSRDLHFLLSLSDGSRVQVKSNRLRVDITPELRAGRRPTRPRPRAHHHRPARASSSNGGNGPRRQNGNRRN